MHTTLNLIIFKKWQNYKPPNDLHKNYLPLYKNYITVPNDANKASDSGLTVSVHRVCLMFKQSVLFALETHQVPTYHSCQLTDRLVNITPKYPVPQKNCKILFYGGFILGWV